MSAAPGMSRKGPDLLAGYLAELPVVAACLAVAAGFGIGAVISRARTGPKSGRRALCPVSRRADRSGAGRAHI